ncbi:MAG: DUF2142 domain-containing protein [Actinomycetota bacterium]|nr:DUF2142 domain-containing protein [Actinomycetota bacterium]
MIEGTPAAPARLRTAPWLEGRGRVLLVCVVVTFANFAVWSWATPLFAAPDEPTQVARAAAVVRGELVGATVGSDRNAFTTVTVPAVFAEDGPLVTCFQFRPDVPASCEPRVPASRRTVPVETYVGRYPPLYYLIVGLPSLVVQTARGIYLMRLVSALLDAVLVSLALFAVVRWSKKPLLLVAVMAAATPMAWFLGGVVNPSGFEIAAALCLWTSGAILVLEHAAAPPPGLVALVASAFAVFVLARPLSPLWCAIAVVVLAAAAGWRRVWALLANRSVQWTIPPLAACSALALLWILSEHSLDLTPSTARVPRPETFSHLVPVIFARTPSWLEQMVGVFGWLDTTSPVFTYALWGVVVGALVISVWVRAVRGAREAREALAVAALVLAVVLLPVAIVYSQVHRLGIVWQGRDIMPLAVGVPILAVAVAGRDRALRRLHGRVTAWAAASVCAALGVAGFAAFFEALRRYAVGVDGPIDFLSGPWHPPLGSAAALVAAFVSIAALCVGIFLFATARARSSISGPPPGSLALRAPTSAQRVG